jgi:cytochrome c553
MNGKAFFVMALGIAVSMSCATGGAGGPPPSETAGTASAAPVVGPPTVAWSAMTKEQRKQYMKAVVAPKAKEMFLAFDSSRYANFSCATCHGDGANDGSFKMPNPRLPVLPNSPDGFRRLMADKPTIMEFMSKQLKPTMAQLLGQPEFNPETKTGFGCMECHTMAK